MMAQSCILRCMCIAALLRISNAISINPLYHRYNTAKNCRHPWFPRKHAQAGQVVLARDDSTAIALATDTSTNITTFASGNLAVNKLMQNAAASIHALDKPFPFVYVPLDQAGTNDMLRRGGSMQLFLDEAVTGRFGEREHEFGGRGYNDMTLYRLELVLRWLKQTTAVLMTDPDIVYLRNPLPYLSSLPACDIISQSELPLMNMFEQDIFQHYKPTRAIAFSGNWARTDWLLMNAGFMMLRATSHTRSFIQELIDFMRTSERSSKWLDDQSALNLHLYKNFFLEGLPPGANDSARMQYIRGEMAARRCLRYRAKDPKTPTQQLSVWMLHPVFFPLRPVYTFSRLIELLAEPPYLVHYNWIVGIDKKVMEMNYSCHWNL